MLALHFFERANSKPVGVSLNDLLSLTYKNLHVVGTFLAKMMPTSKSGESYGRD